MVSTVKTTHRFRIVQLTSSWKFLLLLLAIQKVDSRMRYPNSEWCTLIPMVNSREWITNFKKKSMKKIRILTMEFSSHGGSRLSAALWTNGRCSRQFLVTWCKWPTPSPPPPPPPAPHPRPHWSETHPSPIPHLSGTYPAPIPLSRTFPALTPHSSTWLPFIYRTRLGT